jgi:hypothetical protein
MPKHIVLDVRMQSYDKGVADYQIRTSVTSQTLQQKLRKMLDPTAVDAKELVPEKVGVGTIVISLGM